MKVTVKYKDGEVEDFGSIDTVIHHRGRKQLTLIRNGEDVYVPNSSRPQGTIATEINIPTENIRWWKVER